jgi:hypothetical protein
VLPGHSSSIDPWSMPVERDETVRAYVGSETNNEVRASRTGLDVASLIVSDPTFLARRHLRSIRRRSDHLPILHRQRSPRFDGRAQRTLLVSKAIGHVIADELLRGVADGLAAPFRPRSHVLALHVFLHLVSGIRPARGADDSGRRSARTSA